MSKPRPTVDLGYPTPQHGRIPSFQSIEDEAAYWDTHDTADFPDEFVPVAVNVNPQPAEHLTLRLDRSDLEALNRCAVK
jgi:CopG antitoxin of type II toxin-antitoxin system